MNMYELKCSKCDTIKTYTNKRSWYNAKRRKVQCQPCQNKQLSEHFSGKKNPNYPKTRSRTTEFSEWRLDCPLCKKERYFASRYNMETAIKDKTLCDSCRQKESPSGVAKNLTDDQVKQMRATKAGYQTWEEYKQNYPMKKAYINKVHNLTRKQPLHLLENYDKLEKNWGVNGTKGAYQIDHIKSIDKCWRDGTPPEQCSDLSNLQIITWEDNLRKNR